MRSSDSIARFKIGAVLIAWTLVSHAAVASTNPQGCPEYKSAQVATHLRHARRLASDDIPETLIGGLFIAPKLAGLCAPAGVVVPQMSARPLAPTRAFDQLFYVGTEAVGAWALQTDAGIILFDAMNDASEAREILEPGLRQVGLDPAKIKYIVCTHGHSDHWGGAKYLQDKYGARVLLGQDDVPLLTAPTMRGTNHQEPPYVDIQVTDTMNLVLGNVGVRLYISPGHTPGSISAFFPVTDRGVPHVVALYGGNGVPPQLTPDLDAPRKHAGALNYIRSVERFRERGVAAGADVALSTHPFFDGTTGNVAKVARQAAGENSWVLGKERWTRYIDVMLETARTIAAMEREHPEAACRDSTILICGRTDPAPREGRGHREL